MIALAISVITGSLGVVIDKFILSRRHLSVHIMAPLQFLFLFLITAILVPWIGRFDVAKALEPVSMILFIVMVVMAVIWNVFFYRAIKRESLQEVELIVLLGPLVTTLLSALFLPDERNLRVVGAAIVASFILLAAHFERRHLIFGKAATMLILAVVVMSVESILIKQLLQVWSPAALYLARTFYVFLFFNFLVRPNFEHLTSKSVLWVIASASVGVTYMVSKFYGYQNLGIVYTTLVLAIQPSLTLLIGKIWLREPIKPKYLIATLAIIIAVIYGTLGR